MTSLHVSRGTFNPRHLRPGATTREGILQRMAGRAVLLGEDASQFVDCKYPNEPRWRIDARWIEFECGCRAERCLKLHGPKPYDPIIFGDLPEQAVYDFVCHFHEPAMNKRVHFGKFVTFAQWHASRRNRLMGK